MKKLFSAVSWVNLAGIAAQLLQVVPQKPWVLALQGVLAAFMPSIGGVGHKLVFGNDQDPGK